MVEHPDGSKICAIVELDSLLLVAQLLDILLGETEVLVCCVCNKSALAGLWETRSSISAGLLSPLTLKQIVPGSVNFLAWRPKVGHIIHIVLEILHLIGLVEHRIAERGFAVTRTAVSKTKVVGLPVISLCKTYCTSSECLASAEPWRYYT